MPIFLRFKQEIKIQNILTYASLNLRNTNMWNFVDVSLPDCHLGPVIPQAASYSSRHLKVKKKFWTIFKKDMHTTNRIGLKKLFGKPYGTVYFSLATLHMSPNLRKLRPTFLFSPCWDLKKLLKNLGFSQFFLKKLPNEVKASSFFLYTMRARVNKPILSHSLLAQPF